MCDEWYPELVKAFCGDVIVDRIKEKIEQLQQENEKLENTVKQLVEGIKALKTEIKDAAEEDECLCWAKIQKIRKRLQGE